MRACVREEHLSKCLSDVLDVVGGLGFSLCSLLEFYAARLIHSIAFALCDSASHGVCVLFEISNYAPSKRETDWKNGQSPESPFMTCGMGIYGRTDRGAVSASSFSQLAKFLRARFTK
jgi:hypothetical protein